MVFWRFAGVKGENSSHEDPSQLPIWLSSLLTGSELPLITDLKEEKKHLKMCCKSLWRAHGLQFYFCAGFCHFSLLRIAPFTHWWVSEQVHSVFRTVPHTAALCCSAVSDCTRAEASQQGGASSFSRMNALSTVNILSPASHCDEQTDTNHCLDERKGEWRTWCLCCSLKWWKVQKPNKGRITHLNINWAALYFKKSTGSS